MAVQAIEWRREERKNAGPIHYEGFCHIRPGGRLSVADAPTSKLDAIGGF
jgi:hypothetical protein